MGDLGQVEIPGVGEAKEKLSLTLREMKWVTTLERFSPMEI
jgi:hypothetical protein